MSSIFYTRHRSAGVNRRRVLPRAQPGFLSNWKGDTVENVRQTILIVDDDEDILVAGRLMLNRNFAQVITCRRPDTIPELLKDHQFDAILLDMNFGPGESSGQQGLDWLERILEIDPQLVVVMITAHGSVDTVVEAMKLGAMDFVSKPWQNEKVIATLTRAVALHRSRVEAETLRQAHRA